MYRQNTVSKREDNLNHHLDFELVKYNYKRWNLGSATSGETLKERKFDTLNRYLQL